MGFPCSLVGKESACSAGDLGSIPELGRSPGEANGNPLQYPCLDHGQRILVGCSPWGRKESGMTERLTLTYLCTHASWEMNANCQQLEHSLVLPFLVIWMKIEGHRG